jgi:hypothetical protein
MTEPTTVTTGAAPDDALVSLTAVAGDGLNPVFQDYFIFVAIIMMVCYGEVKRDDKLECVERKSCFRDKDKTP